MSWYPSCQTPPRNNWFQTASKHIQKIGIKQQICWSKSLLFCKLQKLLCGTLLCWWWCCCLQTTVLKTLWVLMALVFVAVLQIAQAAALWVLMWWPPAFAVLQTAQADSSFGAACYRQATRKSFQKSWSSGNLLALFLELGSRIHISPGCIRDSSPRRYCKLQRRFMDCCQWCTAGSC